MEVEVEKTQTKVSTEERAMLDGTMVLTPIVVTPDELMIIARKMTLEASNKAQVRQKVYHRLTSTIVLVYDPCITATSGTSQTTRLPGTDVSASLEKSFLRASDTGL